MYTKECLEKEIEKYFRDSSNKEDIDIDDIIGNIKKNAFQILDESDIENTCKQIKEVINITYKDKKETVKLLYPDKNSLPKWIRELVYITIYQYLSTEVATTKLQYTQSQLLEKMGLYADIFREKHWNIYSPDMKIEQNKYSIIKLPFNHSEVEGNEIYRAMIHYMTCFSAVRTDTFVDMFGKLGVIPALCTRNVMKRRYVPKFWRPITIKVAIA